LERQGLGTVEELELLSQQLDASGGEIRVHGTAWPRAQPSAYTHHELVAQPLGLAEHRGSRRIEDDLQQPFTIAQIDEDHSAVIAPAMHPTGHRYLLADELLVDLSAVM